MTTPLNIRRAFAAGAVLLLAATGCVSAPRGRTTSRYQAGAASYYTQAGGPVSFPRVRTSNGCAHRTAAPGTLLHLRRGDRTATCVVNDRGPFVGGRIVDLQPQQFSTGKHQGAPGQPLRGAVVSRQLLGPRPFGAPHGTA